jgi:hypothetical protein
MVRGLPATPGTGLASARDTEIIFSYWDRMEERYSDALAILQDALDRCRTEYMRTPEVLAALDFLEARANPKWPFDQFRDALNRDGPQQWEAEGRWQTLNASLNGIKRTLSNRG